MCRYSQSPPRDSSRGPGKSRLSLVLKEVFHDHVHPPSLLLDRMLHIQLVEFASTAVERRGSVLLRSKDADWIRKVLHIHMIAKEDIFSSVQDGPVV
jgi:hypothetical protein